MMGNISYITKVQKTILIPAFRWSISCLSWLFKMCMAKGGYMSRNGKKAFFAAVKLHCLISENKLYHKKMMKWLNVNVLK